MINFPFSNHSFPFAAPFSFDMRKNAIYCRHKGGEFYLNSREPAAKSFMEPSIINYKRDYL